MSTLCRPCITQDQQTSLVISGMLTAKHEQITPTKRQLQTFFDNTVAQGCLERSEVFRSEKESSPEGPHHRQYIYHRRDILPKCVVDLVRTWLPNLNDQPFWDIC